MSARRLPWTLPIRRWLVLALLAAFIIPVWVTGFTAAVFVFGGSSDEGTAANRLIDGAANWGDPAWQATTGAELAARDIDFILFADGSEIYRTTDDPLTGAIADPSNNDWRGWWDVQDGRLVQRVVVPGTDARQVAEIYSPPNPENANHFWRIPIAGIVTLLVTLSGIGWLVGRTVNRPLAATSQAARQIAEGDLDVALPSSRVREVAEVNTTFEQMSAALRNSLEEQAELEEERRLFIGAVAHDLRTPLFSLRGYLEGIESGVASTPEQRARYISVAREKADALERLIGDLFAFSRLEYLDQTPDREPLDMAELLSAQVEATQPRAAEKGVEISLVASPSVEISADRHLLTRAIENLLDNALRFTPAGGTITIACRESAGSVSFTIADSGPGIPPADLPHIFAPLYRGESSRNRRTGGAGLGLTIAHRILLAHGGTLTAANHPNGGAIFTATLPASR